MHLTVSASGLQLRLQRPACPHVLSKPLVVGLAIVTLNTSGHLPPIVPHYKLGNQAQDNVLLVTLY